MAEPRGRVGKGVADGSDAVERLAAGGETLLPSFTSEELVAIGANSPLPGLLISERLSEMGPIPLTAALGAALRGLVARAYVDPDAVTAELAAEDGPEEIDIPLGGDLALIVGIRRSPDFVGLVSGPKPAALAGLSLASAAKTEVVLHGLIRPDGPFVLEERRTPLGVHAFALRTLPREASALVHWLRSVAVEGDARRSDVEGIAVEIELALPPGPGAALDAAHHRCSVIVEPGGEKASLLGDEPGDATGMTIEELPDRLAAVLAHSLSPRVARSQNPPE